MTGLAAEFQSLLDKYDLSGIQQFQSPLDHLASPPVRMTIAYNIGEAMIRDGVSCAQLETSSRRNPSQGREPQK